MALDDRARIETATEARQGARGKPVLYVLLGSLALLAIATVALLTWNGANAPKDYASKSQDASRAQITGSADGKGNAANPSANSAGVPAGNPAYPSPSQPATTGSTNQR
ncbi:conserved hypothetical protein [Methylobacterium sp. 4-46]|uniref:hypothetical protein n=1 Tax=unclassified Methylobacterium TaxID=2615210 RepID=UPI000152E885|nr:MULTISPECIES: hypothetical protein [Methylobacterium]ACA16468.1 conserved hypothetical protein [Methylobacterium sp. 4-46]WFT82179.1 hypothetical protein QA634_10160 [Methylobacterium nodulans]